jgi:hypothetical protein
MFRHWPTDVKLSGSGRLQLSAMCKAYGTRILIQAHATLSNNRTSKDVIPPVSLEFDCCLSTNQNFKLNKLNLHVPLRSITRSLDDLRIASHKVDDVENLIREQDWKIKLSTRYIQRPLQQSETVLIQQHRRKDDTNLPLPTNSSNNRHNGNIPYSEDATRRKQTHKRINTDSSPPTR